MAIPADGGYLNAGSRRQLLETAERELLSHGGLDHRRDHCVFLLQSDIQKNPRRKLLVRSITRKIDVLGGSRFDDCVGDATGSEEAGNQQGSGYDLVR